MPKLDEETFDCFAVNEAKCKVAMLTDLFAGLTKESLNISDAGIAGLCSVLYEVKEVLELAEPLVNASGRAPRGGVPAMGAAAERRVN